MAYVRDRDGLQSAKLRRSRRPRWAAEAAVFVSLAIIGVAVAAIWLMLAAHQ